MPRDILSEYGRDTSQPQVAAVRTGGVMSGKDVMDYKPPYGPKGIMQSQSPGLHGRNSGNTNDPSSTSASGSAGLGGTNHGCCGSQGKY